MAQQLFTTPVGRIVSGSLYKSSTTDAEGKPLVFKNGPNTGKPRVQFYFALAIKKGAETHWAGTPWGAEIWKKGYECFPQAANSPAFAWKMEDGDSQVPNKKNHKPCDNEGWAGHWIIKLSGGFAPKIHRQEGSAWVEITEAEAVKPGSFVEVRVGVDGNGSQSQPGVYLNYQQLAFRAYGPEIVFGPSIEEAGFGQSALPAGASAVPPASTLPMPAAAAPTASVAAPPPPAASAPIPPVPVSPNPGFLQVPLAPGAVGAPPPPPPAPSAIPAPVVLASPIPPAPPASPSSGPQMTAKAGGVSHAAMVAAGWNDAQMIAQGYMTV
jgi:hypothetical protein